jgi:UDP-N-acetylglucosamine/UDP-N-acetylgalactosamine diphosphorylase
MMANRPSSKDQVRALLQRGVVVPVPETVEIGTDLLPERIAPGVIIHAGSRILGPDTSIGPGSEIGAEAPATVENCRIGRSVSLKGGYFSGAVFLDGSSMGSGAHVRPGTLLEEEANGAHAVGFKQTILLPFVTAGSLINLCDCLIAGGTSRKNHSEIGSSYIHFNFTPHQDKATASLVGDVPRGVMLDRRPIFLGGQGGLVGPARIAFGTVIPAGVICRGDVLEENRLYGLAQKPSSETQAYTAGLYRSVRRIIRNNLIYIGNIRALQAWYRLVRSRVMQGDPFSGFCHAGALAQLRAVIEERRKRLAELAAKMPASLEKARAQLGSMLPANPYGEQEAFHKAWPELEAQLQEEPEGDLSHRDAFLEAWERTDRNLPYPAAIAQAGREARTRGTAWLQSIVDAASEAGARLVFSRPPSENL